MKLSLSIFLLAPFFNQYTTNRFGIDVNLSVICFVLASFVVVFLGKGKEYKVSIYYCFFLLVSSIFLLISVNPQYVTKSTSIILSVIVSFVLLVSTIRNEIIVDIYKYIFSVSIVILALVCSDIELVIKAFTTSSRMLFDISPISLTLISVICLISSFFTKSKFKIFLALVFVLIVAIVFKSRGPLLALFLVSIFFLIKTKSYKTLFVSIILAGLAFSYVSLSRGELANKSSEGRLTEYHKALDILSESPLDFGYVGRYGNKTGFSFPHNFILEVWVDLGIYFLLLMLVFLVINLYRYYKVKHDDNLSRYYCFSIFLVIFIALQFSMSSVEMLRVLLPLFTLSHFSIKENKNVAQSEL